MSLRRYAEPIGIRLKGDEKGDAGRGRISRQGLAEHRDALMGIAWGLSVFSPSFAERNTELRSRGMAPIQARVALARDACRLTYQILVTQQPFDEEAYRRNLACRPPALGRLHGAHESLPTHGA